MVRRTTGAVGRKGLFTGRTFENFRGTNPESVFNAIREIIYERLQRLEDVVGSGLALLSIEYLTITFCENRAVIGSSFKPFPEEVATRRNAVDNVDNSKGDDQQCFKWAVTRAMFLPAKKPQQRDNVVTKNFRKQAGRLYWDGINFPTTLHETDVFENLNRISVMVLGWDDEEKRVTYLRLPKTRHEKAVHENHYHENHYSAVRKMSALVRRDFGDNANHFCLYCSFHHPNEEAVKNHEKDCKADELTNVKMPKEGSFVEFKGLHHVVFKPFAIYANFENRLE